MGDGTKGGCCLYSFSSCGDGGVESDSGSANMMDQVREQDDSEEKVETGAASGRKN